MSLFCLFVSTHAAAVQSVCLCLLCWISPCAFSFWLSCQLHKRISNLSCSSFISAPAVFFSSCFLFFFACLFVSPSRSQREQRDCAAVWLAAVSGACLSWPTYQWRPRICGRFPVNLSSWLRNWATASSEKSGWVGPKGRGCVWGRGGEITTDAHQNENTLKLQQSHITRKRLLSSKNISKHFWCEEQTR